MSTGTSAWAPQTGGGAPQQAGPPQPVPPQPVPPYGWTPPPPVGGPPAPPQPGNARPPRLWLWALVTTIITVAAVVATAAITYSITRSASVSVATATEDPEPAAPAFTAAQRADAKQAVCQAFDVSSKGMQTQGGARVDGQPNLPMLLRNLSGTVSIQNELVPATPADIAEQAQQVVKTNLDLVNAALGQANIAEVQKATDASNTAVDALVAACGLG